MYHMWEVRTKLFVKEKRRCTYPTWNTYIQARNKSDKNNIVVKMDLIKFCEAKRRKWKPEAVSIGLLNIFRNLCFAYTNRGKTAIPSANFDAIQQHSIACTSVFFENNRGGNKSKTSQTARWKIHFLRLGSGEQISKNPLL